MDKSSNKLAACAFNPTCGQIRKNNISTNYPRVHGLQMLNLPIILEQGLDNADLAFSKSENWDNETNKDSTIISKAKNINTQSRLVCCALRNGVAANHRVSPDWLTPVN